MSNGMPTGLKQGQAGQEFGISINEPVAQGWMIPVSACGGKARMSAACQGIVFALDNEFCLPKSIMISHMGYIEMGTDEDIDIVRTQTKIGEMLQHIFFILGWWRSRWWCVVRRESTIDENVLPIASLNKIATRRHGQRLACG